MLPVTDSGRSGEVARLRECSGRQCVQIQHQQTMIREQGEEIDSLNQRILHLRFCSLGTEFAQEELQNQQVIINNIRADFHTQAEEIGNLRQALNATSVQVSGALTEISTLMNNPIFRTRATADVIVQSMERVQAILTLAQAMSQRTH